MKDYKLTIRMSGGDGVFGDVESKERFELFIPIDDLEKLSVEELGQKVKRGVGELKKLVK